MKKKTSLLLSVLCIIAVHLHGAPADNPSPEQLISAHLKAFGVPDASSQIKSISFVGTTDAEFIQGMHGKMNGTVVSVSQGAKMGMVMKFQDQNYPGEYFAYDGKSVTVGNIQPGLKSPIADFLYRYNKVMKNGMLGGVFSNAWPLLNIKRSKPSYMNVRKTKVEGTELYELEYNPKDRHGDMRIRLFFDPETYRHVRTEYKVRTDNDVTTGFNEDPETPLAISRQVKGESYYTLTEKFDDFKKVGSLTMPHSYTLDYMIDGPAQAGFIAKWKMNVLEIGFNTPDINPNVFKAQK